LSLPCAKPDPDILDYFCEYFLMASMI